MGGAQSNAIGIGCETIHCPLTDETKGIINKSSLALMKSLHFSSILPGANHYEI